MFHAANWFIEIVNGFSTQDDDDAMFDKTISRANTAVQLLQLLDILLGKYEVDLPSLNAATVEEAPGGSSKTVGSSKGGSFGGGSARGRPKGGGGAKSAGGKENARGGKGKGKGGKGKGKGKEEKEALDVSVVTPPDGTQASNATGKTGVTGVGKAGGGVHEKKSKLQMASTYGILTRFTHVRPQAGCFREMDLAVYQLLQSHAPGRQERREVLLTDTTLALLQDMWSKADHALTGHRKPSPFGRTQDASSSGSRDAAWSDPFKFLKSVARLWPALRVIFETTAVDLGATDETVEVDTDKLLGDSPLPDILSTIIAILNKALSCPDLDGARGDAILLPILKCFSSADSMDRDGPEDAPDEMARAAVSAFRMLERIGKEVPTFELCSSMVALLSTLADRGRVAEQTNERVSCLAIFCVRQSWPDATSERPADRGVLTSLIRTHLARSSEPVEKVEALLTEVLDQMPKDSKKQNSAELEDYPCVTCGCFQPFFKVIIEHSSDAIVRLEGQVSSSPSDSDSAHLEELQGLSGSFASLLGLAKKWDDSEVLNPKP
ncbi:hypothetical protein T484DRAFT_3592032 [Baffinella frigidus]|nr:hypothetical protein T484DRAFT_3592032 [Cryptophyta sp. CCMP2293]